MDLLGDIESALSGSFDVPHDLRDPQCKILCDKLTSLAWRTLKTDGLVGEISPALLQDSLRKSIGFPHLNARIYELSWLYRLACMANSGVLDATSALESIHSEFLNEVVPAKSSLMLQGLCDYKANGIRSAQYYFLKANQEYISGGVVTPFFAYSRSICPFSNLLPDLCPGKNGDDDRVWILVSANSAYVAKFLRTYVDSISLQPGVGLHVHWIEDVGDAYRSEAISALEYAEKLLKGLFEFSRETCPEIGDKRSYYASSRFLVAKRILSDKKRLVVTDIDYKIIGDFSKFYSWCSDYDVCLQVTNRELQSFFPWLKVMAGTVVVGNTPMGRYFLDAYSRCFSMTYVPSGFNWGIDQNILGALYDEFVSLGFVGNSLSVPNPFSVPYDIKKG